MNLLKIGATTLRIGANAVARLFLSVSRLLHNIEMLLFVLLEYCARFVKPSLIALIAAENALNATLINSDIPSILPMLSFAPFAAFPVFAIDFDALSLSLASLRCAGAALINFCLYSSTLPFTELYDVWSRLFISASFLSSACNVRMLAAASCVFEPSVNAPPDASKSANSAFAYLISFSSSSMSYCIFLKDELFFLPPVDRNLSCADSNELSFCVALSI